MSFYIVTHRGRPHVVLFAGATLEEAAAALDAQPDRDGLEVSCAWDGASRPLNAEELRELALRLP